jgi:ParB family chromosome partitioning protein
MTRKSGLGRGLDALITVEDKAPSTGVEEMPVDVIAPNPRQPRSSYNPDDMEQLAASIREHGVIQPLIITKDDNNPDKFILIAGERRLIAAKSAGLETVPVIVREASDQQRLVLALIENIQRSDLNPMEEADAYRQLAEDFGLTHEEIAKRVAKSRPEITNTLRLLKLADRVQESLVEGKISKGHARALAALPTFQAQSAALRTVIANQLNVRQTEALVERLSGQKKVAIPKPSQSPEIVSLEERLRSYLGAKVSLKQYGQGGVINIRYFSDEELNSLLDILLPED